MTTADAVQRYSELQTGFDLPTLRIEPVAGGPGGAEPDPANKERANTHYQKVGFQGQPVWGPNIWGYASRLFREYFGSSWVASAQCNIEFRRPLYPSAPMEVKATVTGRDDHEVTFDLAVLNDAGERCAGGTAVLPLDATRAQPAEMPSYVVADNFQNAVSWARGELPIGIPCTPLIHVVDEAMNNESLATTLETDATIYQRLVHPRLFLAESFKIKTDRPKTDAPQGQRRGGIHVGSEAISYVPAPVGGRYRWFGTYIDQFETSKGDQWGRKEIVVLDDDDHMVFRTINKFIFNPAAYRNEDSKTH